MATFVLILPGEDKVTFYPRKSSSRLGLLVVNNNVIRSLLLHFVLAYHNWSDILGDMECEYCILTLMKISFFMIKEVE